ncbi:thiamine pyrophosphate-binding protein [Ornithinimicrobium avium]|uniref:Thiamine pyrophosphate-binding protein n=1 Tax=Ornithinimicrobium avium TaxID=2283195 RepID=A0A345NNN7_9MICO|nr:thiamine pyrophosphate-binding protein [Ornithinimicrobium avium]AXH96645.1 thiamine pyrophosphate-binding protein [Ornithinimicrobium avium]
MLVSEAVGRALVACGVDHVFGVVGSGNFHVTNAMVAAGARFVATRHEGGAATAADGYARVCGRPAAITVHQGCGFTNSLTGVAEAAKSRTPLVLIAPESVEPRSNFYVDQEAMARSVGAVPHRVTSPSEAVAQTVAAVAEAVHGRRTVVLNLPLHVQEQDVPDGALDAVALPPAPSPVVPSPQDVERLADALRAAQRPVFVVGRGGRTHAARDAVRELADRSGALLATSAVAKGLFHDHPWQLDVSGGFSSPLTAELVQGADLIVGWGCALNMWTMRHGRLIADGATVVQVDDTADALGAHRELTFGVLGDVAATAAAATDLLGERRTAYRRPEVGERLDKELRWRDVPYDDTGGDGRIDPRTLSVALDDLLPAERVVSVDSGNFMGYPSMFLGVPDEEGFCFTQAFQSIGLGLATAIGAALARPDRLPVAALGDGGALMAAAELDTVARLGLPMLVVVYDDEAYGAEVHHFGPGGHDVGIVRFPETDIAAIGRGYGFEAVTVRTVEDLAPVRDWLASDTSGPMLVHAKVTSEEPSWWLEEAFRGH